MEENEEEEDKEKEEREEEDEEEYTFLHFILRSFVLKVRERSNILFIFLYIFYWDQLFNGLIL